MLYLISIGLYDEKDMSIRGLQIAKKCEELYVEFYTTPINTNTEKLSKIIGKDVVELKRQDLEDRCKEIIKRAKNRDIGILVGGDALAATTHSSILLEAKNMGVDFKVIHGSSVFSAISETGLQLYKFGKVVTLPFPQKLYKPIGCYDEIMKNLKYGLHTLILLDIKAEENKYMDIYDGLKILLEMERIKKEGLISSNKKIIAVCCLGGETIIRYDTIKNLRKDRTLKNKIPAVLIIPSKLHFMEKEFLDIL